MQVRFGTVLTSEIHSGVRFLDHQAGKEVRISEVYRETPDATDHSGLFQMFVKLDGNKRSESVRIDEGEKVTRFSKLG